MISLKSLRKRVGSSICEMLVATGLMATCLTPVVTPWVSLASKTRTVKDTAQDIRRMRFGLESYQHLEPAKLFAMAGADGLLADLPEAPAIAEADTDSKVRARLVGTGPVRRLVVEIEGKPGLKLEALVEDAGMMEPAPWQAPPSGGN